MHNKNLLQLIDEYNDAHTDPFWYELVMPTGVSAPYVAQMIMDNLGNLFPWIQDPDKLHFNVITWASQHQAMWQRAVDALAAEYNPIHNYNREELGTETIEKHKGSKVASNEDVTETPGVTTTSTGKVVPYDSNVESETGQSVTTPTGTNTRTADKTKNYTEYTDIDGSTFDKDVHTFTDRITRGNIGVTKSTDLVESELSLRTGPVIEELILKSFEDRFLIQAY